MNPIIPGFSNAFFNQLLSERDKSEFIIQLACSDLIIEALRSTLMFSSGIPLSKACCTSEAYHLVNDFLLAAS